MVSGYEETRSQGGLHEPVRYGVHPGQCQAGDGHGLFLLRALCLVAEQMGQQHQTPGQLAPRNPQRRADRSKAAGAGLSWNAPRLVTAKSPCLSSGALRPGCTPFRLAENTVCVVISHAAGAWHMLHGIALDPFLMAACTCLSRSNGRLSRLSLGSHGASHGASMSAIPELCRPIWHPIVADVTVICGKNSAVLALVIHIGNMRVNQFSRA